MDKITVLSSENLVKHESLKEKSLDDLTLPERSALLAEAYKHIDGSDDITDEEMAVIDRIDTALDNKIASWGLVIKKIESAQEICKVEHDYFLSKANAAKERAKIYENKIERMSEYLKSKMIEANKKKVECSGLTVSLRKKPKSVIVEGNMEDPEHHDFVVTTVSKSWNKKAIKELLEKGKIFETAKFSEPDFTLSIK